MIRLIIAIQIKKYTTYSIVKKQATCSALNQEEEIWVIQHNTLMNKMDKEI